MAQKGFEVNPLLVRQEANRLARLRVGADAYWLVKGLSGQFWHEARMRLQGRPLTCSRCQQKERIPEDHALVHGRKLLQYCGSCWSFVRHALEQVVPQLDGI